jgi:hypothetical protein
MPWGFGFYVHFALINGLIIVFTSGAFYFQSSSRRKPGTSSNIPGCRLSPDLEFGHLRM